MLDKDFESLDKAFASAVNAAAYLKEEDERYKDVNPLVPLHVGLFGDGHSYINITCADSDGKKPQVVVLTERMAQDIVREVGACLSVLRAEQEKREE
jgi:hypothetical protein